MPKQLFVDILNELEEAALLVEGVDRAEKGSIKEEDDYIGELSQVLDIFTLLTHHYRCRLLGEESKLPDPREMRHTDYPGPVCHKEYAAAVECLVSLATEISYDIDPDQIDALSIAENLIEFFETTHDGGGRLPPKRFWSMVNPRPSE